MDRKRDFLHMKREKPGIAILLSNKINFKTKALVREKEGHYIMIQGTIQQ